MATDLFSLKDATIAIRSKSDGLENLHTAAGAFQVIKSAQTKIEDTYFRLMVYVDAHVSICEFLNIDSALDWTDVISKLSKAKTWLGSVTNDWDVTALSDLREALASMQELVRSDLMANWNIMLGRIEAAKSRLGFIDTLESDGFERELRLFDTQTTPQSMPDSIDALKRAEELITRIGVGDEKVEEFLEQASSINGASLESMNEPEVQSWLDQENRREKFVIRFKAKGY